MGDAKIDRKTMRREGGDGVEVVDVICTSLCVVLVILVVAM
jgi:hypothetical protein